MSRLDYISLITQSTTLDIFSDTYFVNATGTTGIVITLPLIDADGYHYNILRQDVSSAPVTLQATGANVIYQNLSGLGGSTGSISLLPQSDTDILSFQNNWYIKGNTSTQRTSDKTLFSTAFVTSNTTLFVQVPGGATTPACYFSYPGMAVETISMVECVLGAGSTAGASGTIILRNGSTGGATGTIYGTGSFSLGTGPASQPPKSIFTITSFTGLPLNSTVLEFDITVTGVAARTVNLYSLIVR